MLSVVTAHNVRIVRAPGGQQDMLADNAPPSQKCEPT